MRNDGLLPLFFLDFWEGVCLPTELRRGGMGWVKKSN